VLVGDARDIDLVDPILELTLGPTSLRCAGTLDARTRHHVVEAAELLLRRQPQAVTVDVADLTVLDDGGAETFARLEALALDAGVELHLVGLVGSAT
jgi:anti-anti-sigma regulatory factor